jgi:hypothetical protein
VSKRASTRAVISGSCNIRKQEKEKSVISSLPLPSVKEPEVKSLLGLMYSTVRHVIISVTAWEIDRRYLILHCLNNG